MSSTARGCKQVAVGLAFAGLVSSVPAWSQDAAARQRAAALDQQGDLLQQQAATLQPRTRELERRGAELAAEGKQLSADVAVVERLVREYNAEVGALAATASAQREHCTSGPLAAQQVGECNDEGANLAAQAGLLEQRRAKLDERQRALNQSIDRHNARRLEWERAKREHDGRRDANESDLRQWLQRARAFWSSDGFAALSRAAGSPAVCSSVRLSAADAAHPVEAAKRMQLCLKAVTR
jgi:chromosome segregation ATPase